MKNIKKYIESNLLIDISSNELFPFKSFSCSKFDFNVTLALTYLNETVFSKLVAIEINVDQENKL